MCQRGVTVSLSILYPKKTCAQLITLLTDIYRQYFTFTFLSNSAKCLLSWKHMCSPLQMKTSWEKKLTSGTKASWRPQGMFFAWEVFPSCVKLFFQERKWVREKMNADEEKKKSREKYFREDIPVSCLLFPSSRCSHCKEVVCAAWVPFFSWRSSVLLHVNDDDDLEASLSSREMQSKQCFLLDIITGSPHSGYKTRETRLSVSQYRSGLNRKERKRRKKIQAVMQPNNSLSFVLGRLKTNRR